MYVNIVHILCPFTTHYQPSILKAFSFYAFIRFLIYVITGYDSQAQNHLQQQLISIMIYFLELACHQNLST